MACKLTLVKKFTYRGNPNEQFSNTYCLSGATPADAAAWTTLSNALIAEEKKVYPALCKVIKSYGYSSDADDASSVFQLDLSGAPVSGTMAVADGVIAPGDNAVWVRWKTQRLTSKGRPIYLRKFFHGALPASAAAGLPWDTINGGQRTALLAFGTKLMDSTFLDGRVIVGPGHSGEVVVAREASTVIGYRQLRKGRRRPPP